MAWTCCRLYLIKLNFLVLITFTLLINLLDKSMLASGTECRNRKKSPINLDVTSKISRGDSKFVYRKNLTVCHWFDNKDFFCLSTLLSDTVTTVSRRVDKERRDITCPDSIVDYNKYMMRRRFS